jgi:tape measure domain-containing protein
MSSVDERIVKMVFDNREFIGKVASTIKSLTQLNQATDQIANNSGGGISAMGKAFEQAEIMSTRAGFHIQDVWLKVASILEYQVAGKIVNIGKNIANAMTFKGVADGLKEYETQLDSVQTIMANTGLEGSEGLAKVNATLDELNEYADKTIYNFTQMTRNIGTFTAAGLDLDTSAKAIQGIANLAAVSGSTSQQASTAMYQLSQALAAGTVKLQDWNSVVNAGMGGKVFQNALIQTAATMSGMGDKVDEWKKKHIDAYGSFRESLTKDAWLTTDVLSQTLNQFTMSAEENSEEWKKFKKELTDMGYTEQAANDILKMANTATDAATKVKTFTQLIDTLKEAIGSGWAQSWRIIIGDFEEAKELWTNVSDVLGGFINKTSDARNELLEGWDTLGGRTVIIDALKRAFDALVTVIQPISDAFRNIFPPITATNLYNISKAIQRFTAHLKISEETAVKVRQAASGFFAIFDIGLKFITAFIKALSPAGKGVSSLGGFLLDTAAKLGNFLTKIDIVVTKTKLFERVFALLGGVIKNVISFLGSGLSGVASFIGGFISGFTDAAKPIQTFGDIFEAVFKGIENGFENIKSRLGGLRTLFEGIASIFKGIGTVLGTVFKQIGENLSGASLGGNGVGTVMNLINAFLTGGILYNITKGVKAFSSFGDILDSFGDVLSSFEKKISAEALMNTAKAIAILAGSLVVVAMVDSNKLAGATAAISTMMFSMAGAMSVLMKAVNSFSTTEVSSTFSIFGKKMFGTSGTKMLETAVTLQAVSKALVSMGAAVLMMAVGLRVVSKAAEGGHLWDSFAVVSIMLAELTAVAIALGKWGGKGAEGTKGLIAMTAALVLMAEALKMISKVVDAGNAWEALGIITIMLAELAGIVLLIEKFGEFELGSMLGLISLAVSLNLVVIALKSVSNALGSDGKRVWEALAIVGLMLAGLAAVTVVLSKFAGFAALGGAGAILAATSLLILVQALKQISDALGQTDQHIWQALGVIAASLVVLAIGLTAMAGTIPGAAGLLIASAALIVLGGALKIMGSLKLSEIGKGLLAMAGSLIILAVGLTAMIVALPGAAALVVAAAGLTVLAGALKLFGSMSLGEIAKSLGMLVTALVGLTIITTVLSVASPFVLAFSVALLAFGAAMTLTGVGITLFASGLTALAAAVPVGVIALDTLARSLINLVPLMAEKLMEALAKLAEGIVQYAPTFAQAIVALVGMILDALVGLRLKFGEAVLNLIQGMLEVLTEHIPEIAQAGTNLMIAFMEAISTEIPRLVDEAYKCAIAFVDGLANAIESNNGELIAAVDHLMSAVIQAVTQWLVQFTPLGLLIPEQMKEGIMSGEFSVKDALGNIIKNAVESIKGLWTEFKSAAEYLVDGLIEGLKGTGVGKAVSAAAELGGKVIGGLKSRDGLNEHSPSWWAYLAGLFVPKGLANGIEDGSQEAIDASTELGNGTVGALADTVEDGSDVIGDSIGKIIDDLNKETEAVMKLDDATEKHAENEERSMTTWKKSQEANLKNQQIQKSGYMATMEVAEAARKAQQAKQAETAATEKNTEAKEKNAKASGKSSKAVKTEADFMERASGVVEAFTAQYGKLYTNLGDDSKIKVAQIAIRNLAEETYKASLKAEDATEKNKKTKVSIDEMIKSFTQLKTKIYDSVKSMFEGDNFFQKFEVKTEKSMKDMLEGMRSNVNAVASWTAKLSELGEKGLSQGLLKQLAELGPKGYEYVNAFSQATTEEIQEANNLFAQAGALPESASNSVVASYAKAGLNAVQGFTNAVTEEELAIYSNGENAGTSWLNGLENRLGIESPSKVTYQDGVFLVRGLINGITENSFIAERTAFVMAQRIIDILTQTLDKDIFFNLGQNIAFGLADGMESEEAIHRVTEAAEALSRIASRVTEEYNEIESPSKLYKGYGSYIAQGLAQGMVDGTSYVENSALALSKAIKNTMDTVKNIAEDDMELHPVISPVLDLSGLRSKANAISGLFPGRSIGLASSIGVGSSSGNVSGTDVVAAGGTQINYTQNNYSPKALSRIDIYRDTKNALSMMKGVVRANA